MRSQSSLLLTTVVALVAIPAAAQQEAEPRGEPVQVAVNDTARGEATNPEKAKEAEKAAEETRVANLRPLGLDGVTVFETPKEESPFNGVKLEWGAAFTQQLQMLGHSNAAAPVEVNGRNANELADIGAGFNLATANVYLNAQVAPGIRVGLESYMSSRHHPEFWVKGGYLQMDESPIDHPVLNTLMDYVTIKAGMFELNYGDAHFRRSDNGNALYNPFVESYILDSFNTEIGAEVYFRTGPWLAMVGVTDGSNKGGVLDPDSRGPAYLAKVGFDRALSKDARVRLSGSMYSVEKTPGAYLFGGDRAGSRYYNVMDNAAGRSFTNGRVNPGLTKSLRAVQINPFVELGGLEIFGVIEWAGGKGASGYGAPVKWADIEERAVRQYAGDVIYRFLDDRVYVGTRYNTFSGELNFGYAIADVEVNRTALAAGWFVTPNLLVKGEYVTQKYNDFPVKDILHGGEFNGVVIEGVVAF